MIREATRATQGAGCQHRYRLLLLAWALMPTLLLNACRSKPLAATPAPPPQISVTLELSATEDVNPDRSGRPSPLVIDVFALKGTSEFDSAKFDDLSLHARQTLSASLLLQQRFIIRPGGNERLELKVPADILGWGVVAEYFDLLNATWRAELPRKPPPKKIDRTAQVLKIRAARSAISMTE